MKLRRVLSAFAAAAVATSAMAISAFATSFPEGTDQSSGMFACLLSDDSNVPLFTDSALVATVTKISVTVECRDRDFESAVASGTEWYGGGFGVNSNSAGWDSHEWAIQEGVKELQMVPTDTRYQYQITWDKGTPFFSASDTYAQAWIQDWSSSVTFSLVSFELLNADGVDIRNLGTETPEEPEETVAPAESEEPAAPAEPEETVVPAEPDEPTVEPDEEIEEIEDAEPDWDSYDADAAAEANADFVLFGGTQIDLYSILGDDIYDLATVDATFKWTAGEGWCGGSGLSGVITADGSAWIGGAEYGAANANAGVVDDGVATQTVVDITGNPIEQIGIVEEDGSTTYPQLDLQNWWNGAEAGAELAALTFYNADGDVIGEITWGEEDSEVPNDAANAPVTSTTDNKGNPDTGVAGVAAAAGVVALAGVAVVVARKRK